MVSPNSPRWLNEKMVAEITAISVQTLRNWRHRGEGPKFDKPSPRVVRYSIESVVQFMKGE